MADVFSATKHRPWPVPERPWVMAQSWHDLLFAHWPVNVQVLRHKIPSTLEIDTFQGSAWLGIVPFSMTGVRLRATPPVPGLSAFPELNVRTYVTAEGKPGVWFFSLDAANPLAVVAARATFFLPYFRAAMHCEEKDGWIHYQSKRTHRNAPEAALECLYRANGEPGGVFEPAPGSLEHFLTERYCLYSASPRGKIYRGEIHHPPWQLQAAVAELKRNTMAEATGLTLPKTQPLLHFARRQDMVAWAPQRLSSATLAETKYSS